MTILLFIVDVIVKLFMVLAGSGFLGLFLLWPINDKPVGGVYWVIWFCLTLGLIYKVFL